MNSIRRHLSYANVVATMALVFAMGGSAMAAKHYLINSTSQINPKVIKKLQGKTGKTGLAGAQGQPGSPGPAGAQGNEGPAGLSALSTLPSGQSESGDYSAKSEANSTGGSVLTTVTFPIPLAAGVPSENTVYTTTKVPVPHCGGPGHAARGYLCVYSDGNEGVRTPPIVLTYEGVGLEGSGRFGFVLQWEVTSLGGTDLGTYTVTAP